MPPSSSTKLMTEVTTITGVAWLPTRSSGGQLCVYVMSRPGRSVTVAHDAQKMKEVKACPPLLVRDDIGGHGVVFPELVEIGVVAEEAHVVRLDGLGWRGARSAEMVMTARVLVVGVGAQLLLQPRLQ